MSATVHSLLRQAEAPQSPVGDAVDYCECNRGPVIGVVMCSAGRMTFHPVGTVYADDLENCTDLRCIDCVADAAEYVASGQCRADVLAEGRVAREAQLALLRRSQISSANRSGQTPPTEGAGMT